MSPVREALILPVMLLSVALIGGLRIASDVRFMPPPLVALVLGLLLIAALVRAGVVVPGDFLGAGRTPLENASGTVVALSLAAASAQVFNLLIPDRGLFHVLFATFFFVQLLTSLAGIAERRALLRSLLVLLGSAFILRFLVLEALYARDGGTLTRVLTVLMEGASLGTVQYQPAGAATGYVAFAALALFMSALFLLRPLPASTALTVQSARGHALRLLLAALVVTSASCGQPPQPETPPAKPEKSGLVPPAVRDAALGSARVWQQPAVPVAQAALGRNPSGEGVPRDDEEVSCRFLLRKVGGSTPKFYCTLPDGSVVKVKYGDSNAELHAEVAATRLLSALGFSADRMLVVKKVRCFGCPPVPFTVLRCIAETGLEKACVPGGLDYDKARDFDPAVLEHRLEGRVIESTEDQGWAWFELERVARTPGGTPRAHVDALRLMAIVLAHWDNKAENQRLVCPPGLDRPDGGCNAPVAVIQDAGATFGPLKLDLQNWRATPVWQDQKTCRVGMEQLPFGGGTFAATQISEEGRTLLLGLLEQLSEAQLQALFNGSRVTSFDAVVAEGRSAAAWVAAFKDKVRQIREGGPCSAAATLAAAAAR